MDKDIYKKTGAVLKKARKQKNFTLEDVAKKWINLKVGLVI